MKTIQATLNFAGEVHTIYVQATDEQWADPQFRVQLKDRLELNPNVLRLRESDEPDWKAIAREAQAEAKRFARQVTELTKKLQAFQADERPVFGVVNLRNGSGSFPVGFLASPHYSAAWIEVALQPSHEVISAGYVVRL
jgi:hypothetical protein